MFSGIGGVKSEWSGQAFSLLFGVAALCLSVFWTAWETDWSDWLVAEPLLAVEVDPQLEWVERIIDRPPLSPLLLPPPPVNRPNVAPSVVLPEMSEVRLTTVPKVTVQKQPLSSSLSAGPSELKSPDGRAEDIKNTGSDAPEQDPGEEDSLVDPGVLDALRERGYLGLEAPDLLDLNASEEERALWDGIFGPRDLHLLIQALQDAEEDRKASEGAPMIVQSSFSPFGGMRVMRLPPTRAVEWQPAPRYPRSLKGVDRVPMSCTLWVRVNGWGEPYEVEIGTCESPFDQAAVEVAWSTRWRVADDLEQRARVRLNVNFSPENISFFGRKGRATPIGARRPLLSGDER